MEPVCLGERSEKLSLAKGCLPKAVSCTKETDEEFSHWKVVLDALEGHGAIWDGGWGVERCEFYRLCMGQGERVIQLV